MKHIPKLFLITTILYFLNLIFIIVNPPLIQQLIFNNLPFRESYNPTVLGILYIYIVPIILGFLLSACFTRSRVKNNFYYYFNISIFFGIINSLLFFYLPNYSSTQWLERIETFYYIALIPVMFVVGSLPYYIAYTNRQTLIKLDTDFKFQKILVWLIPLLFLTLLFSLNLIPIIKSTNLIGADIYYHAPMSRLVENTLNISKSPFFKEGTNYYFSITYYIVGFLSKITKLDLGTIWQLYSPTVSALFILVYFLFVFRIFKNMLVASLATLFIFPLRQILWEDPSIRNLSYLFLIIYLYFLSKISIQNLTIYKKIALVIAVFVILATHTEVGIHAIIITFFYLLISQFGNDTRLYKLIAFIKTKGDLMLSYLPTGGLNLYIFNNIEFTFTIFLGFVVLLISGITKILLQVDYGNLTIFNEIPLSVLQPVGLVSSICFLGVPYGLYNIIFRRYNKTKIILSVSLLFSTSIFYFTHLWIIYHRYFTETAYFGLSIIGALFWTDIIRQYPLIKRISFMTLMCVVVGFSILPKYNFITKYTRDTDRNINSYKSTFDLLSINTIQDSVIMVNPSDIINRYIPWYTNRYIFAGSGSISKNQQWQVLSFCNGPFYADCKKRQDLSTAFFTEPSLQRLNDIRKTYEVDYLLVYKKDELTIQKISFSDINQYIERITDNNDYMLFSLRNQQ